VYFYIYIYLYIFLFVLPVLVEGLLPLSENLIVVGKNNINKNKNKNKNNKDNNNNSIEFFVYSHACIAVFGVKTSFILKLIVERTVER
jgi:hypothetical protein